MNPTLQSVELTTDGSGAASGTLSNVRGEIRSVLVVASAAPFANGATVSIVGATTGLVVVNAWQCDDAGEIHPRGATTDTRGVPSLYAAGGQAVHDRMAVGGEDLTVTIASGGDTKTGTVYVITA